MTRRINSSHSHHPTSVLNDEELSELVGSDSGVMSELSSTDEMNSLPMIGHLSPIDFAKYNTFIHSIATKHNMKVVNGSKINTESWSFRSYQNSLIDVTTKDDETFDPMTGLSVYAYLKVLLSSAFRRLT